MLVTVKLALRRDFYFLVTMEVGESLVAFYLSGKLCRARLGMAAYPLPR